MILLGGVPGRIVCGGRVGITPAQVAAGGNAAPPLANDWDVGDDATELLWALLPPLISVGTTDAADNGAYSLRGAPAGSYVQAYRGLFMPASAAPGVYTANITTTVGATGTAPSITVQPQAQAVNAGQTASFSVSAAGTAPLTYQWQRNGSPISGATASSYTTPVTVVADSGAVYSVVVANAVGSVTSASVTLTVSGVAPVVAVQPAGQVVTLGAQATFTVSATGTAPLTYQWQRNGSPISGATASSYTTPPVGVDDAGAQYAASITNPYGSVTSTAAVLAVDAPALFGEPQGRVVINPPARVITGQRTELA